MASFREQLAPAFEISPERDASAADGRDRGWQKCVDDLEYCGVPDEEAEKRANLFFDNSRLIFTGRSLGFADSLGRRYGLPASAVGIRCVRNYRAESFIRGIRIGGDSQWLVMVDAAGAALVVLPDYGWDRDEGVGRWAAAGGLWFAPELVTLEGAAHDHPERVFPGYGKCPLATPGEALQVKRWRGWVDVKEADLPLGG